MRQRLLDGADDRRLRRESGTDYYGDYLRLVERAGLDHTPDELLADAGAAQP